MGRVHEALEKADKERLEHSQDSDSEEHLSVSESETLSISEGDISQPHVLDEITSSPSEVETPPSSEATTLRFVGTDSPLNEAETARLTGTPLPAGEVETTSTDDTLHPADEAAISDEATPSVDEVEIAIPDETTTPDDEAATALKIDKDTSLPVHIGPAARHIFEPSYKYQAIKTKIITRFPDNAIKTIMVTGTSRQCGTTTTAVGFATTLASDCQSRVLLVEANTRLPSFSNFFTLETDMGLSDLFSSTPEEITPFQTAETSNLYIIPAGQRKSGVNTFFESKHFDRVLEKFRKIFDYIILDAPPVVSHDEPKVLGKKVDGVVLVSRAGKSRQRVAIRAKEELEEAGATILGVVLNRRKHYIPNWLYRRL